MLETFFLQAVPFCVSFVVLAFLTESTSPSLHRAPLEQLGYFSSLPSCSILFYSSLGTRPQLQVFFSFWFSGLSIRPSPASFVPSSQALYLLGATTVNSLILHPPAACPLLLIFFLRARQPLLHNFIRWPGGEGERAVI
jgi:hypothetical protein